MQSNLQRLQTLLDAQNVTLRPHLKTVKSVEAARFAFGGGTGPATVSTLAEAEIFGRAGFVDLLYAIGIAPQKLDRVVGLRVEGIDLKIITDSPEAARLIADKASASRILLPTLIELDVDGHRAGLQPERTDRILETARILSEAGCLKGVMTHAGESYGASSEAGRVAAAEREAGLTSGVASAIREAGMPCPIVSVGSTPTAHARLKRSGVTEVRAGVYMFQDLVQAGIGVCGVDEIALSVLVTVIGHQEERGWILTDGGWMALSTDRGTASQNVDQYYGVVCDEAGDPIQDLVVLKASQEQGILAIRPGAGGTLPDLPIGTRLRVLPNHACATAAQHDCYHVVDTSGSEPVIWPRFGGW